MFSTNLPIVKRMSFINIFMVAKGGDDGDGGHVSPRPEFRLGGTDQGKDGAAEWFSEVRPCLEYPGEVRVDSRFGRTFSVSF